MNICYSEFGTQIFCSHPSSENKEISQLLIKNRSFESGFLAQSYVTPPVYILITWPHSYKVNKITFKPSYNRHMIKKMSVKFVSKNDMSDIVNNENFKNIINQFKFNKPDILVDLSKSTESEIVEINLVSEYKRSNTDLFIYNVIRKNVILMLLEIISMKDTSLPCLSNLKIYVPAKRKIIDTTKDDTLSSFFALEDKNNKSLQIAEDQNLETYPDDCLDPLTFQLLINPVKLPCGKYTNLETLTNFWNTKPPGHPKENPFTMVALTDVQVKTCKTVDFEKKKEILIRIEQYRKKKQDLYDMILNPKKRYVKPSIVRPAESDSDEEKLTRKLSENISKNFPFLMNKKL